MADRLDEEVPELFVAVDDDRCVDAGHQRADLVPGGHRRAETGPYRDRGGFWIDFSLGIRYWFN